MRGYFAIGIYHIKNSVNIGTLWRSAYLFGAAYIFTIGKRYKQQVSDTPKTWRHIPLFNFSSLETFLNYIPYDSKIVIIEMDDRAVKLNEYSHPQRAIYVLGAEDEGIDPNEFKNKDIVIIPSIENKSMNVSTAGAIVMYDRLYGRKKY